MQSMFSLLTPVCDRIAQSWLADRAVILPIAYFFVKEYFQLFIFDSTHLRLSQPYHLALRSLVKYILI